MAIDRGYLAIEPVSAAARRLATKVQLQAFGYFPLQPQTNDSIMSVRMRHDRVGRELATTPQIVSVEIIVETRGRQRLTRDALENQ